MYDNSDLAVRCRALWADVLCAVESRVCSINEYMRDPHTRLECQMLSADSLGIRQPSVDRILVANLDLEEHAIQIKEFHDGTLTVESKLPFALLGDGNVYATNGLSLLGDATAVARELVAVLLAGDAKPAPDPEVDEYRSWTAALITPRPRRVPITLPIEIQTETALHPASTIDLSPAGVQVQSSADLDRGNYVTIFRGTLGSFFRVIWAEKNEAGTRAGLVCLNPPLEWAEGLAQ
jgi:hypothetical protein